jgi:hypothetical protein
MGARHILLASMLLAPVSALAQDRPPTSPTPSPSPSASPSPSYRTVRESVEPVVERMEKERTDPCWRAREEGRPCFPVTVIRGPEYSVRGSLGILDDKDKDKPAPGTPPTTAEMREYRPGSQTPVAGFSFDAGCVGKSILKGLKGKNDVYYLYVVRDTHGERAEMYDRKLDPATFQGDLTFLGRFEGECDAVKAWRHEEQRLRPPARGPMPAAAAPAPSPSAR